ncbi:MAG: hypothetical protein LBI60_03350, partial [Bacteroidales bacterium]|nr:hypothetical protein [Bacteroidales bacterium]
MKRYITFITSLVLFGSFSLHAQYDMKGTEFWLTFGSNNGNGYYLDKNLQIRIVANQATAGYIYFTHL